MTAMLTGWSQVGDDCYCRHFASRSFLSQYFPQKEKASSEELTLYIIHNEAYTLTPKSLKASLSETFLSVEGFLFPMINAQVT